MTEHDLRAALDGALSVDRPFLRTLLTKFEELQFLLNDSVLRCASLRGRRLTGDGELAVYLSPGGRVLKVAALFSDPDFRTTVTYRLPPEYWPK